MRIRTWRVGLASGLLVAGVVAGGLVLGVHLHHPGDFVAAGGWTQTDRSMAVGTPLYVGMTYENRGAAGTVTIHSVRAHVTSDTADARTDLYLCRIKPALKHTAVGSEGWARLHRDCGYLGPATGSSLRLNADPDQQVVLRVTLTRPGSVTIKGIDIEYSHGWRRGTQRTGGDLYLSTPRT